MKGRGIFGIAAGAWLALAGCGGGSDGSGSGGGGMSPFDLPSVVSLGGPVLTNPRVQPIYFPGFPFATETDTFLANLAQSQYWTQVVGEYKVGHPMVLPSLATMVAAPAMLRVQDTAGLLMSVLTADAAKLGPASGETIYVLMLPPTTRLLAGEVAFCGTGASGFHAEANVGGTHVPMVVLPACTTFAAQPSLMGFSAISPALAHELIEASTDPLPDSAPAYLRTDDNHPMWPIALHGGEIADLCENEGPNLLTLTELGQPVTRSWSNAEAMAGRDPCVPVPSGEGYFATVARLPDMAQVPLLGGETVTAPAVVADVGAAATVTVDYVGTDSAPMSWGAVAIEYHGDAALMETLSSMQAVLVGGRKGETKMLPVVTPTESSAGVFPLIVLSHSTARSLHLWVGTIERR